MATAVQRQRLELRFGFWDKDKDSKVGPGDFEAEGKRIIEAVGESASSPKAKALLQNYSQMFEPFKAVVGAVGAVGGLVEGGGSIGITVDQFVTGVDTAVFSSGATGYNTVVAPTISAIAQVLDRDGDGKVKAEEFKSWLGAIGVDASSADEAFSALDKDGDGQISVDEIVDAVREYHFGNLDVPLLGR